MNFKNFIIFIVQVWFINIFAISDYFCLLFSHSYTNILISIYAFYNYSFSLSTWPSLCCLYISIRSKRTFISSFFSAICWFSSSIYIRCDYNCSFCLAAASFSSYWPSLILVTSCSTKSIIWSLSFNYSRVAYNYSNI